MTCFPLNPYHWHVVLFTVLPTPPRFGFCMHNFWISPMEIRMTKIQYRNHCYCNIGGSTVIGCSHYNAVIMGAMASEITSLAIVYSVVYLGTDQRKHQSSASLAPVRGIQRWPVKIPRTKGQQCGKCFHLIMSSCDSCCLINRSLPYHAAWWCPGNNWIPGHQQPVCDVTSPNKHGNTMRMNRYWYIWDTNTYGHVTSPEDSYVWIYL